MPDLMSVLSNVSPCDKGGRGGCACTTRVVKGHGVSCPGFVDVQCPRCGSMSVMRPDVAASLIFAGVR